MGIACGFWQINWSLNDYSFHKNYAPLIKHLHFQNGFPWHRSNNHMQFCFDRKMSKIFSSHTITRNLEIGQRECVFPPLHFAHFPNQHMSVSRALNCKTNFAQVIGRSHNCPLECPQKMLFPEHEWQKMMYPVKRWSIWWIQFGTAQEALDAKHVWET